MEEVAFIVYGDKGRKISTVIVCSVWLSIIILVIIWIGVVGGGKEKVIRNSEVILLELS